MGMVDSVLPLVSSHFHCPGVAFVCFYTLQLFSKGSTMGAKLSRKKDEAVIGVESSAPEESVDNILENKEQIYSEDDVQEETQPTQSAPESSMNILDSFAQAVGETVLEPITAPVEDVVNKGIEAMQFALASVSLVEKESPTPDEDTQQMSEPIDDVSGSNVPQELGLLDNLPQCPISEALASAALSSEMDEGDCSNQTPRGKDLMKCEEKVETPSLDALHCKVIHGSTNPNSDSFFSVEGLGQSADDAVNLL
ncbi:hypothetical protein DNTS_016532 [Danionella cerebrum]|uniref:Uncharacterized protein n=1 Tax=Danionella cerebrum TaxID=2873325 RepID=A0A553RC27_9TELE|nr:hypothetical protein DNTS_016532 [Danionella translucida]